MLSLFTASWVVPVTSPPIAGGWVAIDERQIAAVGAPGTDAQAQVAARADRVVDLGRAVIMPAVVNAHTHLELSWMRGQVPPARTMPEWVRALLRIRRASGDVPVHIGPAIEELRACGTGLVGDISNTLASVAPLAASGLDAVVFHEVLGFNPGDPGRLAREARVRAQAVATRPGVAVGLAAHAPYSTAPALFTAVREEAGRATMPLSVHLAESREEVEFLRDGSGPWVALLQDLGSWNLAWRPPACGPAEYLDRLGFLAPGVLAVHGVQLTGAELARLLDRGTALVTCPRSNAWTGAGVPPLDAIFGSGLTVAVGTDSLASAPDLNLFAELAEIKRIAPRLPARRLVQSATLGGAVALGRDREFGSLEPGKRAAVIALALSARDDDPEEAITAGVTPERISWLEAAMPARAC